ncbi:hypothetical protein CKO28_20530 [Rhodovibrio sodomensis]|uniref:Calcineurin-like phosphoesterase domain-containing protein n=1 Tax=Rhodovibrio sodomensis TaxID=1088 RepID=A0ABS1DKU4_9PROT|nr:metallophosphoesterase [Rhodovibrio sodomensis]MBK1670414.1 hypothetical protein [Rhodovibrio sodomensis]
MQIYRSDWVAAPRPSPEGVLYAATGDIHGCADHLAALLTVLDGDFAAHQAARPDGAGRMIFLGDYVSRGPDSAGVLHQVARARPVPRVETIRLRGNHDQFLLDLVDGRLDPPEIADWLERENGHATLQSFLAGGAECADDPERLARDPEVLRRVIPGDLLDLLRRLHATHRIPGYLFAHAGAHPLWSLDEHSPSTFWTIRRPFLTVPESMWPHGFAVIHGHTPSAFGNNGFRIGVDSNCPATGVLTAVQLLDGRLRYVAAASDATTPLPEIFRSRRQAARS